MSWFPLRALRLAVVVGAVILAVPGAAIAAYRAKQAPHVVQVYEVGTQTMLSSNAVYPVFQLMKDNNIAIDWNDLIGPVKTYYSSGGNLYSMAFNSSTPILYY